MTKVFITFQSASGNTLSAREAEVNAERTRCACGDCMKLHPSVGRPYQLCVRAIGRLSEVYNRAALIEEGIKQGKLHRCSRDGKLYSRGRVTDGGTVYKANEFYPVGNSERNLEAVNCPCGQNRNVSRTYYEPTATLVFPRRYYAVGICPAVIYY